MFFSLCPFQFTSCASPAIEVCNTAHAVRLCIKCIFWGDTQFAMVLVVWCLIYITPLIFALMFLGVFSFPHPFCISCLCPLLACVSPLSFSTPHDAFVAFVSLFCSFCLPHFVFYLCLIIHRSWCGYSLLVFPQSLSGHYPHLWLVPVFSSVSCASSSQLVCLHCFMDFIVFFFLLLPQCLAKFILKISLFYCLPSVSHDAINWVKK